jgi:hypothetical protein
MHRVGDSLSFRFCHRFSLTLLLMHRAGGYNYVPSLHACPLLVMLPFPGGFPLQSQTLCPQRHSLPTFLHSVEIQLAVRRRTRAFPPPLREAPSRSQAAVLSFSPTDERRKKPRDVAAECHRIRLSRLTHRCPLEYWRPCLRSVVREACTTPPRLQILTLEAADSLST